MKMRALTCLLVLILALNRCFAAEPVRLNPWLSDKIKQIELSSQDKQDLVAIVEACTGKFPEVASDRLPE